MFTESVMSLLAVATVYGCRPPTCGELAARHDDPGAATTCAQTFLRDSDTSAGLAAVTACHRLHREDEALLLAAQLLAGPRGPDARRIMARIFLDHGQFDVARKLLEDALKLDQDSHDHAGAHDDAATLADEYLGRSDFANAFGLAHVAIAEGDASGDPRRGGTARITLGRVYEAAGDSERADDTYRKAADRLPPDDVTDLARVLFGHACMLFDQRQYALARPLFERARALAAEIGNFSMILSAEVNLSEVAREYAHDLDAAQRHLDAAEAAGRARGDKAPSPGILVDRAVLARLRGDLVTATQRLDEAAARTSKPEYAWTIAHERGQLAAAAHDPIAAERHYLAAIEIVEGMRETSSPEDVKAQFFEGRWAPYQSLFALQVDRREPMAALSAVIRAQGRMFLDGAIAASANGAGSGNSLRAMAAQITTSPLAHTFSADDVLAQLRDRYVLNYFSGAGRLRLLILDHGTVRIASTDIEVARLEKLVDDFVANPGDVRTAQALGQALLPHDALDGAPVRFHIIPDGPLLRVPFAALIADGGRVLDRHEVVYAPSATGLAGMSAGAGAPPTGAIVLSDTRADLPHSGEEIATVAKATNATQWTGRMATGDALRAAHDTSLLHIIGHSGVGADGGFLQLADGAVTAANILDWRIRPRLVVLSSCASAATERQDMWGSLAASFLAAGSSHVVATLFSVEDAAAAEFAKQFYRHHGEIDPVAATAAAQREMARQHGASAWSAFTVIGL